MTNFEKQMMTTPPNLYFGVIENNNDPLKQGRYQVRLLGIDTPNKDELPTENLFWARSVNNFGLISSIGLTRFYRQGTMVVCMLLNNNRRDVIILGTIEGEYTPKEELEKLGISETFQDPDKKYPVEGMPHYNTELYEKREGVSIKTECGDISIKDTSIEITKYGPPEDENSPPPPKVSIQMTENDILLDVKSDDNPASIKIDGASGNIEMKCKKIKIENDEGAELVTLLDTLVDHIMAEIRIGNLGAPCQMDPGSTANYQELKQKIATLKA